MTGLRDELAAALADATDCPSDEPCTHCTGLADALLPIVAAQVARARAEALTAAAEQMDERQSWNARYDGDDYREGIRDAFETAACRLRAGALEATGE